MPIEGFGPFWWRHRTGTVVVSMRIIGSHRCVGSAEVRVGSDGWLLGVSTVLCSAHSESLGVRTKTPVRQLKQDSAGRRAHRHISLLDAWCGSVGAMPVPPVGAA
jgi:hypothetical protein